MNPSSASSPAPRARPVETGTKSTRIDRVGRIVLGAVTLILLVVFARVVQLQVAPSAALREHIDQRISRNAEQGPRGDLRDRRGRLLAATRQGFRIFVDPTLLKPPYGDTIRSLARITGLPDETVGDRLSRALDENVKRAGTDAKPIRYVSIGGVLPDNKVEEARRLELPGIALEPRPVREPAIDDPSLAPLVGVVGIDDDGLLGAERTFDETMRPVDGKLSYVRDSRGEPMWIPEGGYIAPQRGGDVRLSIDTVLQQIASEELAKGVERADAAGGRLLMVDPVSGEVLAMVDQTREARGLVDWKKGDHLNTDGHRVRYRTILGSAKNAKTPLSMHRNRCVEDVYEPGSTFKPFIWSVLTERGYCKPGETFNTHDGHWTTDFGRHIADVTPRDVCTWREVLVYSSNIGMVQGAFRQPYKETHADVLRFGFGTKTGIGLPGESNGIVTREKDWSKYTQSSIPSGYEIAVTPMQMVRAFSIFAREGDLAGTIPELRLTAATPDTVATELRRRVLPPWVVTEARDAMKHVAENMETRVAQYFKEDAKCPYTMFGKSGTAEIPRPGGGGYFDDQYNSSFIVAAPFDHPRIVVLAIIDDPGPEMIAKRMHYGSAVAGPVIRQVVRRSLEYLGVPAPVTEEDTKIEHVASAHGGARDLATSDDDQ
ncbi:MAG TPA: penicillin-binding protein 2 [Phycisphaerales bacterium]|nr:penicillin-binding protein 2 [Phycisphaerales bacterium]